MKQVKANIDQNCMGVVVHLTQWFLTEVILPPGDTKWHLETFLAVSAKADGDAGSTC